MLSTLRPKWISSLEDNSSGTRQKTTVSDHFWLLVKVPLFPKYFFPKCVRIDATYIFMWTIRFSTLPISYIVYCVAFNPNQFLSCTLPSFANAVNCYNRGNFGQLQIILHNNQGFLYFHYFYILSHHVIKDPDITIMLLRHYLQNLPSRVAATRFTTMLLRHYLQNLLSIEQQQQDDVNRAHYDSDVIVYFIPENRTKTQLLLEFWPVRVTLRPLMRFSRNKAKESGNSQIDQITLLFTR